MGYALSALMAVMSVAWIGAQAESHVRIIRLSYIDGSVQMDRATGQGLEKAILNTPVTEGMRIVTGANGLAEVEFENNSTIRLGENSEIQLAKLLVNDAAGKVNNVDIVKGTVYFDTKGSKDDIYRATVGNSAFLIHRDTELRLSDDSGKPTLAVLKGEVNLENQPQEVKIKKKETLTVDPNSTTGYEIAKGVEAAPLDRWNSERSAYQTAYSYNTMGGASKLNAFGYSDLSYYGGWYNVAGIGMAWQPYGVSSWLGWDPYLAGAWSYCPGFGYAWASAYPWGWLPYHYGSWAFVNGGGWYWVPGAGNAYGNGWYYNNFQTAPVVHGPAGYQPPTRPPVTASALYAPTVKVGTIGSLPAYIPGGREIPNFRSVVPNSLAASSSGSSASAPVPRRGTAVVAPRTTPTQSGSIPSDTLQHSTPDAFASHNVHGHVFAAPPPRMGGVPSYGSMGGYSPGIATGGAMSAPGSASVGGGHTTAGGSHAASGGHSGSPR
jgi:hypothetical protein